MPDLVPWWSLSAQAGEPTARWLGFFRRAVSLKLDAPRYRAASPANTAAAVRLPIASIRRRPVSIVAQRAAAPADRLPAHAITPKLTGAASVTLTDFADGDGSFPPIFSFASRLEDLPEHGRTRLPHMPITAARVSLARRLAQLLQPPLDLLLSADGPVSWPGALFPYQVEGVQALIARPALLLADDMGLGKTLQAIAALRLLALQHQVEAALVVVPAALVAQWRQEIERWAPELRVATVQGPAAERAYRWNTPAHVYLTTYDSLRFDFTTNRASPPRRRVWDLVILDEAQRIKNRDTEIARKCKALPRRRAWALTGTPLENSLDDLASLLEFLSPWQEGEPPLRVFPDGDLRARHHALQLRRKKADVLPQLPPKTIIHVTLPLTAAQRETYRAAEEQGILDLRDLGPAVGIQHVLDLVVRLKQICNVCPRTGQSSKLDDLRERLRTLRAEGHRALVFSQFTERPFGADEITARFAEFRPLRYTGALSQTQRQAVIETFKADTDHTVLVVSLRAGGQGLNLQEASYVFHLDRWWNPAVERQAEDRSHRLGQTLPVHVYKYTCEGTIEERIDQVLREKQALFDQVIDDVSLDLQANLTSAELFALFGLTPPVRPMAT